MCGVGGFVVVYGSGGASGQYEKVRDVMCVM